MTNILVVSEIKHTEKGYEYRGSFPQMAFREPGIYKHNTATGELMHKHKDGKTSVYQVEIQAKDAKDVQELIQLWKEGKIRPEPGRSYSQAAQVPTYEEMRETYEGKLAIIKRTEDERDIFAKQVLGFEKELATTLDEIKKIKQLRSSEREGFCNIEIYLDNKMWLVSARKTAKKIRAILNGKLV